MTGSNCPVCGVRKTSGGPASAAATWEAVAAAIGLVAARHLGTSTGQDVILGETPLNR